MKRLVPLALLLTLTTSHLVWADEEKKADAKEQAEKENKTSVEEDNYAGGSDSGFDEGTSDADKRIRTFVYNPDKIYVLRARYGYQSNIEFSPTEEIQTISVGDRSLWQIVPAGHRLFVRPMDENMTTNMTVITNRRSYQFDLKAGAADDKSHNIIYVARFLYPNQNRAPASPAYGFAAAPSYAPPAYAPPAAPPQGAAFAPPPPPLGAFPPPPPEAMPPAASAKAAAPASSSTASMPEPIAAPSAKSLGAPASDPNINGAKPEPSISAESLPTPLSPRPEAAPAMAEKIDAAKNPTSLAPTAESATPVAPPAATPEVAAAPPPAAPPMPNFNYTYSGSDTVAPIQVYDDGMNTYIKYRDMSSKSLPDVYVVTASGQEKLVPARVQGEHVVIEQVAREMVVRSAYGKATIYNEAAGAKVP